MSFKQSLVDNCKPSNVFSVASISFLQNLKKLPVALAAVVAWHKGRKKQTMAFNY